MSSENYIRNVHHIVEELFNMFCFLAVTRLLTKVKHVTIKTFSSMSIWYRKKQMPHGAMSELKGGWLTQNIPQNLCDAVVLNDP